MSPGSITPATLCNPPPTWFHPRSGAPIPPRPSSSPARTPSPIPSPARSSFTGWSSDQINPHEMPLSKHARFLSLLWYDTMNASQNQFRLTRAASTNRRGAKSIFLAVAGQLACLSGLLAVVTPAAAQTKLKLSTLKPGTERVQLISNGDFQFQGPLTSGTYPFPTSWWRYGDIFVGAGSNMVSVNSSVV